MDLDKQINDFLGVNKPKEIKKEMSMQERLNGISQVGPLSLGKTSDYFEEAYKQIEPDPETDKEIEQMFTESVIEPSVDLSSLSIEELETLAEQKTQEIEIEQIAEIGKQSLSFEYKPNPEAQILESVDSYSSALDRTIVQEDEELIDPDKFRLNEMDRKIVAISNSLEGMKGYITEGTLVSGIGQGGDGQLPGGGEVLLRGLDDVDITGIVDGDGIIWSEIDQQFKPGAAGGGVSGDFLPRDGSKPMEGQLSIIYDTQNPLARGNPALSIRESDTSLHEFRIDYQGAYVKDFADPTFEYRPPTRDYLANKGYVDDEILKANLSILNFRGTKDCTTEDPDQPINSGDVYEHIGPPGSTTPAWGLLQIKTADFIAFEGKTWVILSPSNDVYVKKGGDVMSGALKLQDGAGHPAVISADDQAVNLKHVADNYLNVAGGNIHGDIEFQSRMTEQEGIDNQDTDYDGRFVELATKIPYLTDKGYQETSQYRKPFGIRFKLDDGNTFMNTVAFNNRHNRFITISGGVDPAIKFGQNLLNSNYKGVRITGIPMPLSQDGASAAIPRGYVDGNFLNLTGGTLTGDLQLTAPDAKLKLIYDFENPTRILVNDPNFLETGTVSLPAEEDRANTYEVIDIDGTIVAQNEVFVFIDNTNTKRYVNSTNMNLKQPTDDGAYYFKFNTDNVLVLKPDEIEFHKDVDCHQNKLTRVEDPTDNFDAANKQYVDNTITGGLVNGFLPLAGGTMTGNLTMSKSSITIDDTDGTATGKQAKLTLIGARVNNSSPIGSIHFNNNNSSQSGVLGFHSSDTNSVDDAFFKLSHNTQVSGLLTLNKNLAFSSSSSITCLGDIKITLRKPSNNGLGNAAVQIERAHTSQRKSFAISGKDSSNNDNDILFAHTNTTGGDSVEYRGRISGNDDIATVAYVKSQILSGTGNFLPLSGGTLTGDLLMSNNNAVFTRKIDSGQNSNLTIGRDNDTKILVGNASTVIYNDLKINGSNAEYLGNITDDNHLVTKKYVDDIVGIKKVPVQNSAPSTEVGAIWFNPNDDTLYIRKS